MTSNTKAALFAAGAVAVATVLAPGSQAWAQANAAPVTKIILAQHEKKKEAPKRGGPRHEAPRHVAPQHLAPRHVAPRTVAPKTVAPKFGGPKVSGPKVGGAKVGAPKLGGPKVGGAARVAPKIAGPKGTPRVFSRKGPEASKVIGGKLRGLPGRGTARAFIHGKNYSAWRSGHRVRYHGRWRTLAGLSTLAAILIGTNYFYPYAYIAAPEDYCVGLTEDGCQLVWEEVETIDGDLIDQCVAYCPWQ